MSESGLSLTRNDLRSNVGTYAGFGLTYSDYASDQLTAVDRAIDIGLRKFYSPLPLPGEKHQHTWSFLTPVRRLSLVEGQVDYDLSDDFAGLVNGMFLSSDDLNWSNIEVTNIARILAARQRDTSTNIGKPVMCAVNVIETDGTTPTRYSLAIFPTPDMTYTLSFEMRINPYQLSATAAYPLGGQPHAETLRESCLAAWEQNFNDERGLHTQEFLERLVASVHHDRKAMGPKSYGYNGDRSAAYSSGMRSGPYCGAAIYTTYNGAIPG